MKRFVYIVDMTANLALGTLLVISGAALIIGGATGILWS